MNEILGLLQDNSGLVFGLVGTLIGALIGALATNRSANKTHEVALDKIDAANKRHEEQLLTQRQQTWLEKRLDVYERIWVELQRPVSFVAESALDQLQPKFGSEDEYMLSLFSLIERHRLIMSDEVYHAAIAAGEAAYSQALDVFAAAHPDYSANARSRSRDNYGTKMEQRKLKIDSYFTAARKELGIDLSL